MGMWVGPDGESVLPASIRAVIAAALIPISATAAPEKPSARLEAVRAEVQAAAEKIHQQDRQSSAIRSQDVAAILSPAKQRAVTRKDSADEEQDRYQDDWATRVDNERQGERTVKTDYHYFGTGDIGGAPDEDSVKPAGSHRHKRQRQFPTGGLFPDGPKHPDWPEVKVGDGPVHVISATADQMFLNIDAV